MGGSSEDVIPVEVDRATHGWLVRRAAATGHPVEALVRQAVRHMAQHQMGGELAQSVDAESASWLDADLT